MRSGTPRTRLKTLHALISLQHPSAGHLTGSLTHNTILNFCDPYYIPAPCPEHALSPWMLAVDSINQISVPTYNAFAIETVQRHNPAPKYQLPGVTHQWLLPPP